MCGFHTHVLHFTKVDWICSLGIRIKYCFQNDNVGRMGHAFEVFLES